jgi:hypothetical protein
VKTRMFYFWKNCFSVFTQTRKAPGFVVCEVLKLQTQTFKTTWHWRHK